MAQPEWYPFDDGSTIGGTGSEKGIILRDEEYSDCARITLERDAYAPFAITCGIYGWMVHTCFFRSEAEANEAFESMKVDLTRIDNLIPLRDDPEADHRLDAVYEAISAFVEKFP